jgi:hypothetical protein
MKICSNPQNINDLPLWQAMREAELRSLPLSARRLARRYGLDPATARLMALHAGLSGNGGAE